MTILLWTMALVFVVAAVVTIVAVVRAKAGFEDEHGFHAIREVAVPRSKKTVGPRRPSPAKSVGRPARAASSVRTGLWEKHC